MYICSFSFLRHKVFMGLKEAANEPSSALRHCTELEKVLSSQTDFATKPIVLVYSDGGFDHRITYLTTKIALISLFLRCDLDFLAAVRTAPYQPWKNPVERIMLILNLALQGVGLMRKEMPPKFEAVISSCKSVKDIRSACFNHPGLKEAIVMSTEPVKILLELLFVSSFHSSSSAELDKFWNVILQIESSLTQSDTRATVLRQKHGLRSFLEHFAYRGTICSVSRNVMTQNARFALLFACHLKCLSKFISFQILFLILVKSTIFHFQNYMEHRQVKTLSISTREVN